MAELKPCPFCGGEPNLIVEKYPDGKDYCVKCINLVCLCNPETVHYDTKEEAEEAWNVRADNG